MTKHSINQLLKKYTSFTKILEQQILFLIKQILRHIHFQPLMNMPQKHVEMITFKIAELMELKKSLIIFCQEGSIIQELAIMSSPIMVN